MPVLDDVAWCPFQQTNGGLFKRFLDSWPQCGTPHQKVQRAEQQTSNNTPVPEQPSAQFPRTVLISALDGHIHAYFHKYIQFTYSPSLRSLHEQRWCCQVYWNSGAEAVSVYILVVFSIFIPWHLASPALPSCQTGYRLLSGAILKDLQGDFWSALKAVEGYQDTWDINTLSMLPKQIGSCSTVCPCWMHGSMRPCAKSGNICTTTDMWPSLKHGPLRWHPLTKSWLNLFSGQFVWG